MYQGKEICQGCRRSGTETPRYSKDELCQDCKETIKLGRAKEVELNEKYTSVSSWSSNLPGIDFGDRTLSNLLSGLLKGLHNPYANATNNLFQPFNPHNIHGSENHIIPTRVVEPMTEFFDKIQTVINDIREEKKNLPKMAREAVQDEKDRIYNEGIEKGRNLLFQLNEGAITETDFAKKITYRSSDFSDKK